MFPFKFEEKEYHACTNKNSPDESWCLYDLNDPNSKAHCELNGKFD